MKIDIGFKGVANENHAILTITDYPPLVALEEVDEELGKRGVWRSG